MGKYEPLANYLHASRKKRHQLTFKQIEAILGDDLPPSAHKYNRWWNGPSAIWLSEGWRAIPNRRKQKVVFVRDRLAERLRRDKKTWLPTPNRTNP